MAWKTLASSMVGLAVVAAAGHHFHFNSSTTRAVAACQEEIKERIRTPSTFRSEKVEVSDTALPYREWLAAQGGTPEESKKRRVDILMMLGRSREQAEAEHENEIPRDPIRRSIVVAYDASNLMGAMIRSEFTCDHYLRSASDRIEEDHLLFRRFKVRQEKLFETVDELKQSVQTLEALQRMARQK